MFIFWMVLGFLRFKLYFKFVLKIEQFILRLIYYKLYELCRDCRCVEESA